MAWAGRAHSPGLTSTTPPPYAPSSLHRHPQARPLPPIPTPWDVIEEDLIPPPLFANRTRTPPNNTTRSRGSSFSSSPLHGPRPLSRSNSTASTAPSLRSTNSTISSASSSLSSPPSSPITRRRSLSHAPSPTPSTWAPVSWDPDPQPVLKRKKTPKMGSLRTLRAKESEADLRRIYDQQTSAYLDGSVFVPEHEYSRLGSIYEE